MAEDKEKAKAPKIPSAQKRDRQSLKRRERNRICKSQIKTAIRHWRESETKQQSLATVYSLVDKGVKKGIIPQSKANRIKSTLSTRA